MYTVCAYHCVHMVKWVFVCLCVWSVVCVHSVTKFLGVCVCRVRQDEKKKHKVTLNRSTSKKALMKMILRKLEELSQESMRDRLTPEKSDSSLASAHSDVSLGTRDAGKLGTSSSAASVSSVKRGKDRSMTLKASPSKPMTLKASPSKPMTLKASPSKPKPRSNTVLESKK